MKGIFKLDPRKLIAGKYFGQFQSIFSGLGTEMTDARPYTPGDSAKTINRKTSAKHQQLYSNVYQQEKAIAIDIFRDMNYNRNGKIQSKKNYEVVRDMMSDIILYAKTYGATLTIFYPETKGIFRKTTTLQRVNIGKNYDQAINLMIQLSRITKQQTKTYQTYIPDFLSRTATDKRRHAIVVFSDFLDITDAQVKQFQQVKKEHVLVLFQVSVHKEMGQNYNLAMLDRTDIQGLELLKIV